MSDERICFFIAPIGSKNTPERIRTEQVLEHIVSPAVEKHGYKVLAAHKLPEPGSITGQIIKYLESASLVAADLSDHNPNVFYELAIRHALKKSVVQLLLEGQSIPFDLGDIRTIYYTLDLDGVGAARKELSEQVGFLETNPVVETPISKSLESQLETQDLTRSYAEKRRSFTEGEVKIMEFIERKFLHDKYASVSQKDVQDRFERTYKCTYWRLQNLCSLGFLQKERTGTVGRHPTFNYRLTSGYQSALGAVASSGE